jgi:hypothetical protein
MLRRSVSAVLGQSCSIFSGPMAQKGKRLFCKQDVVGSIPSGSTKSLQRWSSKIFPSSHLGEGCRLLINRRRQVRSLHSPPICGSGIDGCASVFQTDQARSLLAARSNSPAPKTTAGVMPRPRLSIVARAAPWMPSATRRRPPAAGRPRPSAWLPGPRRSPGRPSSWTAAPCRARRSPEASP